MCCDVCVEVREQHGRVSVLLSILYRFLGWSTVCQACIANLLIHWAIFPPLPQMSFISPPFPLIFFFNSYFHSQNSQASLMWWLEKILTWRAAWVPDMMLLFRDLEMEVQFHAWLLVQMQSWSHHMLLLWAFPRSDQEGSLLVELVLRGTSFTILKKHFYRVFCSPCYSIISIILFPGIK